MCVLCRRGFAAGLVPGLEAKATALIVPAAGKGPDPLRTDGARTRPPVSPSAAGTSRLSLRLYRQRRLAKIARDRFVPLSGDDRGAAFKRRQLARDMEAIDRGGELRFGLDADGPIRATQDDAILHFCACRQRIGLAYREPAHPEMTGVEANRLDSV